MSARAFRLALVADTPALLAPALAAALWPVWRWYAARLHDGSDEPLGLIALIAALALVGLRGWMAPVSARRVGASAGILAIYVAGFGVFPPLVRAALGVAGLAWLLPRRAGVSPLPVQALLVLSLPMIASLQYVFGFPLRAATAWCTAHALELAGWSVRAQATVLHWAGEEILLDAPCSGIRILWMAAFLSATIAGFQRLSGARYLTLAAATGAVVFAANVGRSIALFFLETGQWPNPAWAHECVGIVCFAIIAAAVIALAAGLQKNDAGRDHGNEATHVIGARLFPSALLLALGGAAGLAPLANATPPDAVATAEPEWPTSFEGRAVTRAALHPIEERFARDFPGAIAAFTDGERRIVRRRITQPTRKLHPAIDCLRASGFAAHPLPALRQPDGALWSAVAAEKDGEHFLVRERITGPDGAAWTDVSAWYWSALLRPQRGPWDAETAIERQPAPASVQRVSIK